jgi:hypothetical protein
MQAETEKTVRRVSFMARWQPGHSNSTIRGGVAMLKDLPWLLLRRLMGPLTLHDDSTRPEWCRSQAETKPAGFFDGLYNRLAPPTGLALFSVNGSVVQPAA